MLNSTNKLIYICFVVAVTAAAAAAIVFQH
jgi:hypothetical protein